GDKDAAIGLNGGCIDGAANNRIKRWIKCSGSGLTNLCEETNERKSGLRPLRDYFHATPLTFYQVLFCAPVVSSKLSRPAKHCQLCAARRTSTCFVTKRATCAWLKFSLCSFVTTKTIGVHYEIILRLTVLARRCCCWLCQ